MPPTGPALLVANHPNSLLDPMLVAAAARRPLRFLAKAPLFEDPKIAWLVKAAGAIPVHRRIDDPTQMDSNEDMFREVTAALTEGAAIALFPEGVSHDEPSLAPLRTGAARIALGAGALMGAAFPIVPMGLVFREKDVFRSRALVLTGEPAPWDDLARRGTEDSDAVRALTARIAEALRALTINLERWEDQPLVECSVRIWEAEHGARPDPAERIARLETTTRVLSEVRRSGDAAGAELSREVETHRRRLSRLGLRPADLVADLGLSRTVGWAARRSLLLSGSAVAMALTGFLLYWVPYRLTGWLVDRLHPLKEERSTWKLLVGAVLYTPWTLGVAIVAGLTLGVWAGLGLVLAAPLVGMAGLVVGERWRGAWEDARRFLLLRTRRPLIGALRGRQRELGERLDALHRRFTSAGRSFD